MGRREREREIGTGFDYRDALGQQRVRVRWPLELDGYELGPGECRAAGRRGCESNQNRRNNRGAHYTAQLLLFKLDAAAARKPLEGTYQLPRRITAEFRPGADNDFAAVAPDVEEHGAPADVAAYYLLHIR
jgi:hypothetical protein